MVLKYATEIAALNKVIAILDADLASNLHWQALNKKKHDRSTAPSGLDPIFEQLRLEQKLAQDPVYRARIRLLETVQTLQQVSNSAESQPTAVPSAKPTQDMTPAPPVMDSSSKDPTPALQHRVVAKADATAEPSSRVVDGKDDLMRIRGVTRALSEALKALGVTQFSQIANWTCDDRRNVSEQLGLEREILRQNWIDQAALLAAETKSTQNGVAPGKTNTDASVIVSSVDVTSKPKPQHVPAAVTVQTETPHVLIKSAAHGLIHRLQANNDTKPDVQEACAPATKIESERSAPPVPAATIQHEGSQRQSVFSSQITSEHSCDVVGQEGSRDKGVGDGSEQKSKAAKGENTPPAQTSSEDKEDARQQTIGMLQASTPRDKLRFRRLRKVSKRSNRTEELDKDFKPQDSELAGLVATQQVSQTGDIGRAIPNPLVPPPVPKQKTQAEAFKNKVRWHRRPPKDSRGGAPGAFGDGHLWRHSDPVLTGPVLNEDSETDPRFFAHTEEASVVFVRKNSKDSPSTDTFDDQPRSSAGGEGHVDVAGNADESALRHPAKRIFKALKRD